MAIREQKGRSLPWECYWNNPFTKKREYARFATKREAEKHDSLIKHRLRFDRESFFKEDVKEQPVIEKITLERAYLMYLQEKEFDRESLAWQMKSMKYPLEALGGKPVADINLQDLENVKKAMLLRPVKPVTTRGHLSVLRTVLRWAHKQGLRGTVEFPTLPPARYERFVPPTSEEILKILAAAMPHVRRVIILGAQFGIRIGPSEVLRLQWTDVDLNQRVIHVRGSKKNPDAQWRDVPIRQDLLPVFEQWRKEDETAGVSFLVSYDGKPIKSIKRAWKETLKRAGITRRIRPYDLRHAFGTELVAAGVDIGTVAKLMGHANPTMLLTHYQYVMDRQKRGAVEALPSININLNDS